MMSMDSAVTAIRLAISATNSGKPGAGRSSAGTWEDAIELASNGAFLTTATGANLAPSKIEATLSGA